MATLKCLWCGRGVPVPERLIDMSEKYQGKPVCFCSRDHNVRWVAEQGRKGQEKQMRDMIDRMRSQSR